MNKFTVIGTCGQGSAGSVMRAKRWATGEEVAIKKLSRQRFKHGFDEVLMLREVQALRQLRHPNIIALKELIRELLGQSNQGSLIASYSQVIDIPVS